MDSDSSLLLDKSSRYNQSLLVKLSESEIKNSELTAACLARDSEILRLENKIYELSSALKKLENEKSLLLVSASTQTQEIFGPHRNENCEKNSNEKNLLILKIKSLEKSLLDSEAMCDELEEKLREKEKEITKLKLQIKEQDSTNESLSYVKGNSTDRSLKNNNDWKEGTSPRSLSHNVKSKSTKKLSVPKLSLITIINAHNSNVNLLSASPKNEWKMGYYSPIYKSLRNSPVKLVHKN
ncbi:unnamed protein product [Blepharisma stoltei]|uniref:Uncharacterized protein n=1 Tax=Blepharisma stoltei TaxID=1481888 RepID=A0AAU9JTU9_9CILI|nr:unnamed protein product [Blepharisma stoltei]